MIIKRLHLLTVLVACCLTALEAGGARRLWNESFFSAPQLKRDSLGGCAMPKTNKTQSPSLLIPLRITVVDPPKGVEFRLQRGRSDLVVPTRVTRTEIQFDFTLRLGPKRHRHPILLGEAAQGPPEGRFVYINSGRRVGQDDTCWDRRAKVPLPRITDRLIKNVLTASDGGPACATVPLLGDTWTFSPTAAA